MAHTKVTDVVVAPLVANIFIRMTRIEDKCIVTEESVCGRLWTTLHLIYTQKPLGNCHIRIRSVVAVCNYSMYVEVLRQITSRQFFDLQPFSYTGIAHAQK